MFLPEGLHLILNLFCVNISSLFFTLVSWLATTKPERAGSTKDVRETMLGLKLEVGLGPRIFCLISSELLKTFLTNFGTVLNTSTQTLKAV